MDLRLKPIGVRKDVCDLILKERIFAKGIIETVESKKSDKDFADHLNEFILALKKEQSELEEIEFDTCCNGRECGCQGMPIDPEYYVLKEMNELLNHFV